MRALERILVPVDYSTPSGDALDSALSLAEPFGASVDVLHVWIEPTQLDANLARAVHRAIAKRAAEDMSELLSKFQAPPGVALSSRVVNGEPPRVIIDLSKSYDLIAMGTHGRGGIARLLLGSVAARVVQRAHCPVMTQRGPGRTVRRILAPVDFSENSREATLNAATIARALDAELEVLHVWNAPMIPGAGNISIFAPDRPPMSAADWMQRAAQEALDGFVADLARGDGLRIGARLASGTTGETIVAAAEDFDLVVMGTHGRSGASRLFLGSIAERVIRLSSRPVITVRGAAGE